MSWLAAAAVALMLLFGPAVVAHDSKKAAAPSSGGSPYSAPDGRALFVSKCGSCHTLQSAGTSGQVGPDLTHVGLDAQSVEAMMKAGPGVMPSFDKSLSAAEFHAVARFVASR